MSTPRSNHQRGGYNLSLDNEQLSGEHSTTLHRGNLQKPEARI